MNAYASFKPAWHIDKIADLRAGKDVVPSHVQLIISDLCNQNCHFCLVAGTLVSTPNGDVPIEEIRRGQTVFGPNGKAARTGETSVRRVEEVVEITVGERLIRASIGHPVLTQDGWKEAGSLTRRDSAVVRVRMRAGSDCVSNDVEYVRSESPEELEAAGVSEAGSSAAHAGLQSDEGSRYSGESVACDQGREQAKKPNRFSQYCGGSSKENVVRQESDARQRDSQSRDGEDTLAADEQERTSLQGLAGEQGPTVAPQRRRLVLGGEEEPRFSSGRAEEAGRSHSEGMLRCRPSAENTLLLRSENDQALREQRVEVSSGLQKGPQELATGRPRDRAEGLHVAGVELERGLELRPIDSIRIFRGDFLVYNFSCEPHEAYEANGFVVHNCAYRAEGGFSTAHFPDAAGNRNPVRFIPTAKCKEILDDCAALGVKAVQFTGGGEPTVHPDHLEIIGYAQQLGLKTSLVTNGVRLKDHEVFRNLEWLRISLDAGTEETYAKTRESKMWPKVLANLKTAASFEKPYMGVGFVVTPENYREIFAAAKIVKAAGVPYMRVSAVFSREGSAPYVEIYDQIKCGLAEARNRLCDDSFSIIDFFGDRIADLDSGRPDYSFCGYQQFTLYIGGDQKVYSCCTNSYTDLGEIGDLRTQRFADWLRSSRRFDFDARRCHHCQFNRPNKLINYLLSPAPMHVDFV